MSISGTPIAGVFNTCLHGGLLGRPIVYIPAVILAIACGATYVASPLTKSGCDDGDKVAVASSGWAHWVGEKDVTFKVANRPTPKAVCVTKLDQAQAAAFDQERKLSWDDFTAFTHGN